MYKTSIGIYDESKSEHVDEKTKYLVIHINFLETRFNTPQQSQPTQATAFIFYQPWISHGSYLKKVRIIADTHMYRILKIKCHKSNDIRL